jgi:threonine dehydrogenase-like Zn-dependent dehydrogenase
VTTPLELSGQIVLRHCLTLRGFHNYAPRHLEQAVTFLKEQKTSFPWSKLVSPTFPLSEINAAFAAARTKKWARVSVRP